MLDLLGMDFDIPYDKEPFYTALFSIAIIILLIGYYRRNIKPEQDLPILNDNSELQTFDVLSQPISTINNDEFPKEGVLFNNSVKSNFISTFFTTLIACIIFGIIVVLL